MISKAPLPAITLLAATVTFMLSSCSSVSMLPAPASKAAESDWPAKPTRYKSAVIQDIKDLYANKSHDAKVVSIVRPTPVIHKDERLWRVEVHYETWFYYFWSRMDYPIGKAWYFFEGERFVDRVMDDSETE